MTLQQQAYGLIDRLPDDSVQVVIQVMRRMLPHEVKVKASVTSHSEEPTAMMKAYWRMQELRKETAHYDVSETERAEALDEKYGTF